jgi:hypothetical protein
MVKVQARTSLYTRASQSCPIFKVLSRIGYLNRDSRPGEEIKTEEGIEFLLEARLRDTA